MEDKKQYEISFLLRQEQNIEILMAALKRVGAEIINEGRISEIKLAYPIKKVKSALFGYLIFEAPLSCLKNLRSALNLDKNVLRFLIVAPPLAKFTNQPFRKESEVDTKEKIINREQPGLNNQVSNEELNKKLEEMLA